MLPLIAKYDHDPIVISPPVRVPRGSRGQGKVHQIAMVPAELPNLARYAARVQTGMRKRHGREGELLCCGVRKSANAWQELSYIDGGERRQAEKRDRERERERDREREGIMHAIPLAMIASRQQ